MKKIILILLALCVLTICFASCSAKQSCPAYQDMNKFRHEKTY